MAEPEARGGEQAGRQPPQQQDQKGGNGGEQIPDDPETLQKMILEERRKYSTLLNENKRVKAARDEFSTELKRWSKLKEEGHDPDQIAAILSKREAAELEKARDTGEVDKLLENQRKKYEKEIAAERERAQKVFDTNRKLFIDERLNQALDKIGVEPKLKRGAALLYRDKFTIIEDPDSPYGMRTVVKVGPEDYMEPDEFLKNEAENNEDFAPYLKQSMASGGGASGGRADPRLRFKARKDMTPAEKSQYIRTHGKPAYDSLPWSKD